jgi:hypothetical protein
MSSPRGPNTRGEGISGKRGPGRPKGSGKKIASPATMPLVSRKRGRPMRPRLPPPPPPQLLSGRCPRGSGKKAASAATAAPSPARRHGRPPGIKSKQTLAALAATASSSAGPNVAASSPAGLSWPQPVLPLLQPPAYTSAEGWSTFIVPVLAGARDRLRLPS